MKQLLLLLLGSFSLLIACNNDGINRRELKYHDDETGIWYSYNGKPYTGKWVSYYGEGEGASATGEFSNGRSVGKSYYYETDGQISQEFEYQNGKALKHTWYYTSKGNEGKIDRTQDFDHDRDESVLKWYDWCGKVKRKKIRRISDSHTLSDEDFPGCN